MTTLTIDHPGTDLANALQHVRTDHESVMIEQDGHVIAVIVPPDILESLEDLADIRKADRVLADIRAGKEKTFPLSAFPAI